MRRVLVLAAVCAAACVAASAAGATNECKGLQVCVPVVGPWVVTGPSAQVSFQLTHVEMAIDALFGRPTQRDRVDD